MQVINLNQPQKNMETKTIFQINPVSKQVIINTTISTSTNNSHVSELFLKLICQFWAGIVTEGEVVMSKLTC
jgi:hypothetical protein